MNSVLSVSKLICLIVIFNNHAVFTLDSCASRFKCEDCIRDYSICAWCPTNNFNGTRCKAQNTLKDNNNWCPEGILENPFNVADPSKNRLFNTNSESVVQIKPQGFKIKLRPGTSQDFKFSFQGAEDFPVDLYFLMDASATMSGMRNITATQSEEIYFTMKGITKNVQLGFGSFVDKCSFPFTNTFNTEETYSFRHRLSLTDNFTAFKETVRNTPEGYNADVQEGGLDALAQVMVCKDVIKWRDESRKIIIFLTDGYYHAAGDGRLAGILTPYDEQCYMENGSYTKELELDYPSPGMINKLAMEKSMLILFFVEHKVQDVYNKLSAVIFGSRVSEFYNDTGNTAANEPIAVTLKEIYEKVTTKITLKKNIKAKYRSHLDITFKPNCTSASTGKECDVQIGKEKQFVGTVKLLKYDEFDHIVADIAVESITEKLSLDIDVIKNCNCTSRGIEEKSTLCNGEKRICGECDCGEKRYGKGCICEKTGGEVFNDNTTCIMDDSNHLCSGHGVCECGQCRCRPGYAGKFCQCSQVNCALRERKLCSGEERGKCLCGKCICEPGWTGEGCECSTHDCMVNEIVCSGHGQCICGSCVCDPLPLWDKRTINEIDCTITTSLESHGLQCMALEDCVKCILEKKNKHTIKEVCISCMDEIQAQLVENITAVYFNSSLWISCPDVKVSLGCYSKFAYRYMDNELELVIENQENCAETHFMFGGVCFLVLIVIGVLTLVGWKLMTDARDRREYQRFLEKSQSDIKITENPLYKPASSAFKNPGFGKRSFK